MKTTKKLSGSTYMRHLVKIIKAESVMIVTTGSGERRMRNFFFLLGIGFQFYKMKGIWGWMVAIVAQQCEYI